MEIKQQEKEEIIFNCDTCQYKTINKYLYGRHINSKRHLRIQEQGTIKPIHKCTFDNCDFTTKDKSNYNRHKKTHEGTIKHYYKCVYCKLTFRDKGNAKQHKKSKQHNERTSELFRNEVDKLDHKNLMMKTDENGENEYFKQKRIIRQKIREEAFIKVNIDVVRVSKRKNKKEDKEKFKKYNLLDCENIINNMEDYDLSIIPELLYNVTDPYQLMDFKEQYENFLSLKEYDKNDLYEFIEEIVEDIKYNFEL